MTPSELIQSSSTPSFSRFEGQCDATVDTLVAGMFGGDDDSARLCPTLSDLNTQTNGWIQKLVSDGQIRGKLGEMTLIASPISDGPTMILVVGLGDSSDEDGLVSRGDAFELTSAAIRKLSDRPRGRVVVTLAESVAEKDAEAVVSGAVFGCEGQAIYKTDTPQNLPSEISISNVTDQTLLRGVVIGRSINHTRRLVNGPACDVYPESFADAATLLAKDAGLEIEVWDEKKLKAESCRAILAVGQGSTQPPRLVILRHNGGGSEPPIAIVGKGVTFDSGGLSIKPSDGMVDMKCDMAGAATVVGVMEALARLGVKKNVIGLCGLAENMVSGNSYKLGDVIETRSGKTIEILNTDAEGRVVLADTLDVAIGHQPSAMVDLATLTGACLVALGLEVTGLMTNDDTLCHKIMDSADQEGEPVWQLPMFKLYDEKIKSKVADIKNIGEGRWGGAITAAKFLEQFVGETPWVHMDIAGPAFADSPKPHRDAGATGAMVRSLIRWIEASE